MKGRSDRPLTIALSLSLVVHAGLGGWLLREQIAELTRELYRPPIMADELRLRVGRDAAEADEGPLLSEPPTQTVQDFAFAEPPHTVSAAPVKPPEKVKKTIEENSEWGEKEGTGTAVTSAPGAEALSTPKKANQDQSYTSRDPRGPQPRPEEPSMSTAPPGQEGDGQRAMQKALEGHGTQGEAAEALEEGMKAPATPPPPVPVRPVLARDDRGTPTLETSGPSSSRMPLSERRSSSEGNYPPAERDSLPNDVAWGEAGQILPVKRIEVIGVRSAAPAYPEVVAALTRPPGVALSPDPLRPLDAPVLPATVAADVSCAREVQPATAGLGAAQPHPEEEMALRVGEPTPIDGPAVVEALTHAPDERSVAGGASMLPEVVAADEPSGPTIADATIGTEADRPRFEEMAERVEMQSQQTVAEASKPSSPAGVTAVASAQGGLPGPAAEAADPAPDTGLESDAFSKAPGVEFRDGRVAARSGRQVKPVRPRLSEPAKRDLLGLQFPTILAKVRIDKTGKVVDVTVLRGSGSQAVDMPVYRALWDWWFEPPRDKKGNPLDDVQLVAIHWG